MKRFVLLAVSVPLVGILFCPMVMAAPSMPSDLQMVQPDPSLPKELSGFWGKWEGQSSVMQYFLIIEKIDKENASVYLWRSGWGTLPSGWERIEAKVSKEYGKYILWFVGPAGVTEVTFKGDNLYIDTRPYGSIPLKRVR